MSAETESGTKMEPIRGHPGAYFHHPTYDLTYDAENRLTTVSGAASANFVYDGDGNRVKATFGSETTVYPSLR
jgi:YD repeat-containing protein